MPRTRRLDAPGSGASTSAVSCYRGAVRILLVGRPGIGKTTVVRRLVDLLREAGVPIAGFTTEEIREGRGRVGFAIESVDGARATLAHVTFPGPTRVGKYGVDTEAFERLALPALDGPADTLVIVDELGKMELASKRFCAAIDDLLSGGRDLVATVHAHRHPRTDGWKQRPDVELVEVTAANRDELPGWLAARVSGRDG